MRGVILIAANTFKETIRNKVLYNILLFAGIIITLSISFGNWSVFARIQVMEDFGLATMSMSGLLLAVFIGVTMLGKDITDKTIYNVASKPVNRGTIIVGKYLGLCATLFINFFLMALFFIATIIIMGGALKLSLSFAILLTAIEMMVIVAAAVFFSTITAPTLAAIFTITFYIIGHINDLIGIEHIHNPFIATVIKVIYWILPNLEHFNIRTPIVYNLPLPDNFVLLATIYGLFYTIILLILSSLIFSKRDL